MAGFSVHRVVEWGECDPAGIVFYPTYFAWMDAAFHALTRSFGVDQARLQRDHGVFGTPIVDARCGFENPARDGDAITIEVSVRDLGNRSTTIAYRFRSGDRLLADGHETRVTVCRDGEAIVSAPMPAVLRDGLRVHHVG